MNTTLKEANSLPSKEFIDEAYANMRAAGAPENLACKFPKELFNVVEGATCRKYLGIEYFESLELWGNAQHGWFQIGKERFEYCRCLPLELFGQEITQKNRKWAESITKRALNYEGQMLGPRPAIEGATMEWPS